MALFSQRKGTKPLKKEIQKESIDEDLKNSIWSALSILIWSRWSSVDYYGKQTKDAHEVEITCRRLWLYYFKKPIDEMPSCDPSRSSSVPSVVKGYFYSCKWDEIFDLVEFLLEEIPESWSEKLKDFINQFLETENSAYRIIDKKVVEITSDTEIEEVESAIQKTIKASQEHLKTALQLLSDKTNPDFRNSIKESISAVEAACRHITGEPSSTLGKALNKIELKHELNPVFKQALDKLYGYTCGKDGIRHALTEEGQPRTLADAKFMLVSCSAFINYLWAKTAEK
jgi:hypothetical protein